MFESELAFFIAKQDELVAKYPGKVLVLKDASVIGVFDSALKAYTETSKKFPAGTFMIQPCEPGPQAYTVTVNLSLPLAA